MHPVMCCFPNWPQHGWCGRLLGEAVEIPIRAGVGDVKVDQDRCTLDIFVILELPVTMPERRDPELFSP